MHRSMIMPAIVVAMASALLPSLAKADPKLTAKAEDSTPTRSKVTYTIEPNGTDLSLADAVFKDNVVKKKQPYRLPVDVTKTWHYNDGPDKKKPRTGSGTLHDEVEIPARDRYDLNLSVYLIPNQGLTGPRPDDPVSVSGNITYPNDSPADGFGTEQLSDDKVGSKTWDIYRDGHYDFSSLRVRDIHGGTSATGTGRMLQDYMGDVTVGDSDAYVAAFLGQHAGDANGSQPPITQVAVTPVIRESYGEQNVYDLTGIDASYDHLSMFRELYRTLKMHEAMQTIMYTHTGKFMYDQTRIYRDGRMRAYKAFLESGSYENIDGYMDCSSLVWQLAKYGYGMDNRYDNWATFTGNQSEWFTSNGWTRQYVGDMGAAQLKAVLDQYPDCVLLAPSHTAVYDAASQRIYEASGWSGEPRAGVTDEAWDVDESGRPVSAATSGDQVGVHKYRRGAWNYIFIPPKVTSKNAIPFDDLADIYADAYKTNGTSAFVLSKDSASVKGTDLETGDHGNGGQSAASGAQETGNGAAPSGTVLSAASGTEMPPVTDGSHTTRTRRRGTPRSSSGYTTGSSASRRRRGRAAAAQFMSSADTLTGLDGEPIRASDTRSEMNFVYKMNAAVADRVRDDLGDDKPVETPSQPPAIVSTTCEGRTTVDTQANKVVPVANGDKIDVGYVPTKGYTIDGRRTWKIGVGDDPAPDPAMREKLCNVVFDPNGDANRIWDTPVTGTMRSEENVHYWTGAYLPKCGFRREHYDFMGWATERDGNVVYKDGDFVQMLTQNDGATVTLYAVWRPWTRFNLDLTCDHDVSDNYDIPSWQAKQAFHAGDNGWYNLTGAVYGVSGDNGMSDDIIVSESVTDDKSGENQIGRGFVYVPSDADYEIRLTRTPRKAIGGGIGEATDSAIPSGYVDGEDIGVKGVKVHAGGAFPYDKKEDFDKYGSDTMLPDTARIRIVRKSGIPEKTRGNANYELSGAAYRVSQLWNDEKGANRAIAVRDTRADRMASDGEASLTDDVAYLKYGTYDVVEVSNSRGYEYDLDSDNAPRHWNVTLGGDGSGGVMSKDGGHVDTIAEPGTYVGRHVVDDAGKPAGQSETVVFSPMPYLIDVQADVLSDDPDYTADYDGAQNPNYDLASARYRLDPVPASGSTPWFKGADGSGTSTVTDAVREERAQDARELHDARLDNVAVSYDSKAMTSRTSGASGTRQRKATVTWAGLPLGTYSLRQTSAARGFEPDTAAYRLNASSKVLDGDTTSRWSLVTSYAKSGDNGVLHGDSEPDAGFVPPSVRGPWFAEGQREVAGKVKLSDAAPDNRHAYVLRSYNVPKTGTLMIDAGADADRGNAVDVRGGNDAIASKKEDVANQAWFGIYYDRDCEDMLGVANRAGEFKDARVGKYGAEAPRYDTLTRVPFPVGSYYVRMLTAPLNYDLDPNVYEIDLDEGHPDVRLGLADGGRVRSIGYLKAARHSESPKTTTTNANYDLTGAVYGVYDDAAAAHRAAKTVMDKRRDAQDEVTRTQGRVLSPDDGYAVISGGRVLTNRIDLERVRMEDVSDHLADTLTSMTLDEGGTVAKSDDTRDAHYAPRAWLKRGVTSLTGAVDENATGDYSIRTGDYYVTEVQASKGYDPVRDEALPVRSIRVLRRIDPEGAAGGRTVAEIGGWRYELTGGTKDDVYVGLALEKSGDGMVERPVAVSMSEDAVSMRRTRIDELGNAKHVEDAAASEKDGSPLIIENEVGKWYVSDIPGVRADEYLPDLAATGTTLVESDTKDGYGVTHEEAARRVIASIPSVGYGREVSEDHEPGDAVTKRLDFEAKLRPFPVYVRYVMASTSQLTQDDVVIGDLGGARQPKTLRDTDRVFNAKYAEKRNDGITNGDGNAFRSGSDETGSKTARVMPLEWPVSDKRDDKWHERWLDRPYQVAVRITDPDDTSGYDAFTEREYPRIWAWRRVADGHRVPYLPDGGVGESDIAAKPYAYVPSWLSSYDPATTPDLKVDGGDDRVTDVDADPNNDSTKVRFDLMNGIDDVKARNGETGIYPDLRDVEAIDDWYPTLDDGGIDMSRVVPVYENYIEVVSEGVTMR